MSSDEIKQSYSQIRLLAIQNDNYAWIPIADGTLCRGSEAKDITGKRENNMASVFQTIRRNNAKKMS